MCKHDYLTARANVLAILVPSCIKGFAKGWKSRKGLGQPQLEGEVKIGGKVMDFF